MSFSDAAEHYDSEDENAIIHVTPTEHVAAMGGDTDFLSKAKAEKKVAAADVPKKQTEKAMQRVRMVKRRERALFVGDNSDTALIGNQFTMASNDMTVCAASPIIVMHCSNLTLSRLSNQLRNRSTCPNRHLLASSLPALGCGDCSDDSRHDVGSDFRDWLHWLA